MLVISLGYLSFADFCRHYCRVPMPPGTSWNCVSKISRTWKVLEMSLVLESPTGRRPIRSFSPGGSPALPSGSRCLPALKLMLRDDTCKSFAELSGA